MVSTMSDTPEFPLLVFYDGSCLVCAAEIEHYLGMDHGGRLLPVDISAPGFDPEPFRIPLDAFMHELHAVDRNGRVFRGVDAFRAIWQAFPDVTLYVILGAVIKMPLVNPIARLFYKGFARLRSTLPKRHGCASGTCRTNRDK